jgi:hypothetical protein
MARYQITYNRTDRDGDTVKGTVIYRAANVGSAIDAARVNLAGDDDTTAYTITDAQSV